MARKGQGLGKGAHCVVGADGDDVGVRAMMMMRGLEITECAGGRVGPAPTYHTYPFFLQKIVHGCRITL
jgi:hypothetical protein